jgi:hypothetical protein
MVLTTNIQNPCDFTIRLSTIRLSAGNYPKLAYEFAYKVIDNNHFADDLERERNYYVI